MKYTRFLLLVTLLWFSCKNEGGRKPTQQAGSELLPAKQQKSLPYTVTSDEATQKMLLVKQTSSQGLTSADVLNLLHSKYSDLRLQILKTSNDSIFLKIDDARKLTQEMGSAGAQAYLAELTYSFTEVSGIKAVNLEFEEGDHAMPGTFTRADFSEFKVIEGK